MEAILRIVVRCIDTGRRSAAEMERDRNLLAPEERSRMARLRNLSDRRDYAAAHAMLRNMLSVISPSIAAGEWRFTRNPWGKPILPPAPSPSGSLSFSICHTRGFVACALCYGTDVGIDVELDASTLEVTELARIACSALERAQIEGLPPASRVEYFLDLWTLKEAYLKAHGIGISEEGLAQTCFDLRRPPLVVTSLPGDYRRAWAFSLLSPMPGCRVAVAAALPTGTPPRSPLVDAVLCGADGTSLPLRSMRSGLHPGG